MTEKGYVMKNGEVIITDNSAKLIRNLRENGIANLDYTLNRLQELLLPNSSVVDPIEADIVHKTIMDIALNPDSIEKYVERIKTQSSDKKIKNKFRPYL